MIIQITKQNYLQYLDGLTKCLSRFGYTNPLFTVSDTIIRKNLDRGTIILILLEDDQVVSTATLYIHEKLIHGGSRVGQIEDVATLYRFQGKGYARQLVNELISQAKYYGCYKVILDCADDNINFYSKCGFKVSGRQMRIDLS